MRPSSELIINVKGLCKSFGKKKVVNHIDLQVYKGEVLGFLGANGSGKTTTIRMLCGLLKADAGVGTCLGFDLSTQSDCIKQHVGYMTQRFSLYSDLTVKENLLFIGKLFAVQNIQQRLFETVERLDLTKRLNQLAGTLSGGWKQRLSLACCLIHNPPLLLLDEPTAGVDPVARREFWDQIHYLSEQGVTSLVSTHYMDEAERCTRIAYLAYGKLLTTGTVEEVILEKGIKTWVLWGPAISTPFLSEVKKLPGVEQCGLFGSMIHISGYDQVLIEQGLRQLEKMHKLFWAAEKTSLEDTFITLVKESKELSGD
jgi:ABC-2 type transport system ATP-binding protein